MDLEAQEARMAGAEYGFCKARFEKVKGNRAAVMARHLKLWFRAAEAEGVL